MGPTPVLAADATHVVQEGETLSRIAEQFGVSVDTLAQANGLEDPNRLHVGLVLKLPLPVLRSYTVEPGDTLSAIAAKFGLSVDVLAKANELAEPDFMASGTVLKVPDAGTSLLAATSSDRQPPRAESAAAAAQAAVSARSVPAEAGPMSIAAAPTRRAGRAINVPYVVKAGDTLTGVARQFETTVAALAEANGVSDPNLLGVGQTIQVPSKTLEHEVQPGETLRAIAAMYTVDLGTMVDYNELPDPNLIRAGDVLLVPRAAMIEPQPPLQLVAAAVQPQTPAPSPPFSEPAAPAGQPASVQAPPSGSAPVIQTVALAPASAAQPAPQPKPAQPPAQAAPTPKPEAQPRPGAPSAPTSAAQPARPSAPAVAPGPPGSQAAMAAAAVKLLGKPYAWGGSSESGFDCSGYVWYVAKQAGVTISRGLRGQYDAGSHPDRKALKPGDLVFFQNTYMPGLSHNGIYVGDGKFAHAADESQGVTISNLDDAYWSTRLFGITRVGS
jgi:peptidoglycan endopeptidase LytE